MPGPIRRIVLVHGAAHGAWCWTRVTPLLRARGFDVDAVDLPGLGADRTPPEDCTLAACVGAVAACVMNGAPVVLVGHSMAGQIVSQVAEDCCDHVARIVYVAAFVPVDGETLADMQARDLPNSASRAIAPGPDARTVVLNPAIARHVFYGQCADEEAAWAIGQLRPQPTALMGAPVTLTPDRFGRVPKSYVLCERDEAIPPSFQDWLCARWEGVSVRRMPTDHSPFLSDPAQLAAIVAAEAVAGA
ncbi:MAG: alpha/beta fold hydrolase [Hyphomonadaceae bacterium]|nr:alpha/beta fold hydrolase [Hyphomonadaceae bacterium]